MNRSHPLSLLLLAPLAAGCAASDDRVEVSHATLTEQGDSGDASRASYTYVGGLTYEAYRPIDGVDRLHHLDVMDYRDGRTPELAIGVVYVDGPAVDGRGDVSDHVGEEGVLVGDFPVPWIDLLTCDGDIHVEAADCRMAEQTTLWLEDAGDGAVRVHYEAIMPGDTEPSVSGWFVAVPGTLHG